MKFLAVHPSCLMYSKIYLRLEPLGNRSATFASWTNKFPADDLEI